MKRKILSWVLTICIAFCFTGCRGKQIDDKQVADTTQLKEQQISSDDSEAYKESNEVIPELSDSSKFEIHFLDVGQADAALVCCDDKSLLIDGGNVADSSLIVSHLKMYNIQSLDYVICSHADEDHVGGLSGALSVFSVGNVYAPKTEADSKAYFNFKRKINEQGITINNPKPGDSFILGSSKVIMLGPINEAGKDKNNTSIVAKIIFGNTSFLFTGDAGDEEEHELLDSGVDLSADLIKVGHHGSGGSTGYRFLREVMPDFAVISVGKNNAYGHPSENTLSRLRDAGCKVYRTDMQGDIIATSNGKNITISTSRNQDVDTITIENQRSHQTVVDDSEEVGYIGNLRSKKFHLPTCKSLPYEKNRIYFSSREEAINSGYSPCGNCHP